MQIVYFMNSFLTVLCDSLAFAFHYCRNKFNHTAHTHTHTQKRNSSLQIYEIENEIGGAHSTYGGEEKYIYANGRIILKWKSVGWNHLALDADKLRATVKLWVHKNAGNFLTN